MPDSNENNPSQTGPSGNNSELEQVADSADASLPEDQSAAAKAAQAHLPKIISFDSLARCGDEIWIENGGQIYRLRRTRQGKLILTK